MKKKPKEVEPNRFSARRRGKGKPVRWRKPLEPSCESDERQEGKSPGGPWEHEGRPQTRKNFEGWSVAGDGKFSEAKANRKRNRGTRRTPGSGAGRNKPAGRRAEKAVKVERNHEGGRSLPFGKGEPKRKEKGQPGTK
jgi:hypothetical protein